MSLIPVDAEYHYVQDTAPTSANAGDVWLDTSVNPPVAKIYADVGSGLEWLVDQSSDRIATNLDAKVSQAGQGVDWASKTPKFSHSTAEEAIIVSVSGSGYLMVAELTPESPDSTPEIRVAIDGTDLISRTYFRGSEGFHRLDHDGFENNTARASIYGPMRFESSITLEGFTPGSPVAGTIAYVLD